MGARNVAHIVKSLPEAFSPVPQEFKSDLTVEEADSWLALISCCCVPETTGLSRGKAAPCDWSWQGEPTLPPPVPCDNVVPGRHPLVYLIDTKLLIFKNHDVEFIYSAFIVLFWEVKNSFIEENEIIVCIMMSFWAVEGSSP